MQDTRKRTAAGAPTAHQHDGHAHDDGHGHVVHTHTHDHAHDHHDHAPHQHGAAISTPGLPASSRGRTLAIAMRLRHTSDSLSGESKPPSAFEKFLERY